MIDSTGVPYNVVIRGYDRRGRLVYREIGHNRVVTAGRNLIRDFLYGDPRTPLTRFQLGAGATPVSNSDTALQTLIHDGLISRMVKDVGQLNVQFYLGTGQLNGSTIREAGLVTAAPDNILYARYSLATPIVKTSALAYTFTWTLVWTATGMSINIETGHAMELGGVPDIFKRPSAPNAYQAGAGLDTLSPGSGVWYVDSADLPAGSEYVLEGIVRIESAGAVPKIALFNMTDAPNVPLVGSEVTGVGSVSGEFLISSSITFPAGGDPKILGIKATSNNIAKGVAVYGARIRRIA